MSYPNTGTLTFTVSAALLQELGERLIGKPYIALAELVKNSYDADATRVTIRLDLDKNQIIVSDNGHGMTYQEFVDYWMRVGTTHKQRKRVSKNFNRIMQGEKGVGRLSVQLLAQELELYTVSDTNLKKQLKASVEWEKAIASKELTEAPVDYRITTAEEEKFEKGTKIILRKLNQEWNSEFVIELAKEIWWLQPPFRNPLKDVERSRAFKIEFESSEKEFEKIFSQQLKAIFSIWYAKIIGSNNHGHVEFTVEYHGEEPISETFSIPDCELQNGSFEIRIYHLFRRQPKGISVNDARKYFREFGGVHVYDGGFHLPFYGYPENDWLRIEWTHSHRLSTSQFLPEKYHIPRGLQFLPTLSRMFGVVNVNTRTEENLDILITRDRLQKSRAYDNLITMVRYAIDYYAFIEKTRATERDIRQLEIAMPTAKDFTEIVNRYAQYIPQEEEEDFKRDFQEITEKIIQETEEIERQASSMGSLASVGASTLAFQHETRKQFTGIEDIIEEMEDLIKNMEDEKAQARIKEIRESLVSWLKKTQDTFRLFGHFLDAESLTENERYNAFAVVTEVLKQTEPFLRNINVETKDLNPDLLLPKATLAEWTAIFQNIVINAINTLLDSDKRIIDISSHKKGMGHVILIQDTGSGVDLKTADDLFKPFVRKTNISPERRELGYGGTGIGLTIVRVIANRIGCKVSFVEPGDEFKTAFSISWSERK